MKAGLIAVVTLGGKQHKKALTQQEGFLMVENRQGFSPCSIDLARCMKHLKSYRRIGT
jgi:hypothetical protein